ncbi:MAG: hypothetical protein J0H82_26455 [Alphaproteobacteria bacterium]|jgi:hypothetical protein|nr:hypothetical protein [Alphaproteobacteria bacterium]
MMTWLASLPARLRQSFASAGPDCREGAATTPPDVIRAATEICEAEGEFLQALSVHGYVRHAGGATHRDHGGRWHVVAVLLHSPSRRFRHVLVHCLIDLVYRFGPRPPSLSPVPSDDLPGLAASRDISPAACCLLALAMTLAGAIGTWLDQPWSGLAVGCGAGLLVAVYIVAGGAIRRQGGAS